MTKTKTEPTTEPTTEQTEKKEILSTATRHEITIFIAAANKRGERKVTELTHTGNFADTLDFVTKNLDGQKMAKVTRLEIRALTGDAVKSGIDF